MSWLEPAPAPRLGQCWGFGRLKVSVPFWSLQPLLFPSGLRALLGPSRGPCISSPGMPIVRWQPEAMMGSILQPKYLGMSPLAWEPSTANIPSDIIALQISCQGTVAFWDDDGNGRSLCRGFSRTHGICVPERALLQRHEGLSRLAFRLPEACVSHLCQEIFSKA